MYPAFLKNFSVTMTPLDPSLNLAIQYHQAGNFGQAEQMYRQILQADPRNIDALHLLGLVAHQVGRNDLAVGFIRRAIEILPTFVEAFNSLGIVLNELGQFAEAADALQTALRLKPDYAAAHCSLGNVFLYQRKLDQAIACYQDALRFNPQFPEAHNNLANAFKDQGKVNEALAHYQQALEISPTFVNAYVNRGNIFTNLGRLAEAETDFRQALRFHPQSGELFNHLGQVLWKQGKADEALAGFQEAVRLQPDLVDAHNNLGVVYLNKGRVADAIAAWRLAVLFKPDYAEAHNNLGIALVRQEKYDEAAAQFERALALKPDFVEVHCNLGLARQNQGQFDEALACYRESLRHKPDYIDAHFNLGTQLLLRGDLEQGWPEYEWRCRNKSDPRRFSQPLWDGSDLTGKTILLHAEQGIGDVIQFVRYAPLIQKRGGIVVFECPVFLTRLLARLPGVDRLVPAGNPLPDFDVHMPLLSVPGVLGTTLATIPADIPYLFAESDLIERWRKRVASDQWPVASKSSGQWSVASSQKEPESLSSLTTGHWPLRVGISWQGNPKHADDRYRSIPLTRFEPLARIHGVQLFSLQKVFGTEQIAEVSDRFRVVDLDSQIDDLVDTAAVMMNLDLVITVDSAPAHLAGALGVPVWVALPFVPDWRWLLKREDSPWYPTMRLFRQTARGDWNGVFERMAECIEIEVEMGLRVKVGPV